MGQNESEHEPADEAAFLRRSCDLLDTQGLSVHDSSSADLCDYIAHYAESRDTLRIVAGRLVAETLDRGLSLRQIADKTGVSSSTLHRWAAPFRHGDSDQ